MKSIETISVLYHKIFHSLSDNQNLRACVTGIYTNVPKKVIIPYLNINIVDYKYLHAFAIKDKLSCHIYAFHLDKMFYIMKQINITLKNFHDPHKHILIERNGIISQRDEILHSIMNFDILTREE
ncbi:DUF3168 domain-containing protein [Wolbachia endosymbiont of Pentidionis agamae]|uniref:DUF3168 domain-containing protein n=1 Tax=Wolbachia endosymbiont of Pentidionis agamae TaxID=3110435 RepID=UPI002FCE8C4B